jgi:surface protein
MPQMFYNCSSLDELDLSNFNTSKVEIMGQMFYNTPNLKTIYASENFVTTALSGDNSSKDMFS